MISEQTLSQPGKPILLVVVIISIVASILTMFTVLSPNAGASDGVRRYSAWYSTMNRCLTVQRSYGHVSGITIARSCYYYMSPTGNFSGYHFEYWT
jgi:hypothetical protein